MKSLSFIGISNTRNVQAAAAIPSDFSDGYRDFALEHSAVLLRSASSQEGVGATSSNFAGWVSSLVDKFGTGGG